MGDLWYAQNGKDMTSLLSLTESPKRVLLCSSFANREVGPQADHVACLGPHRFK